MRDYKEDVPLCNRSVYLINPLRALRNAFILLYQAFFLLAVCTNRADCYIKIAS